jgi:tRNA1Val (adenine37-N6)-methyltransferase
MAAQRNHKAKITAIEINEDAIVDASFNIQESPWSDRVELKSSSLQEFKTKDKYDVIVSNPPFFENSLRSSSSNRNNARHTDSLHYTDILKFAETYLNSTGIVALILPVENAEQCILESVNYGLSLKRKTWVKPVPHKPAHRIVFELTKDQNSRVVENELIVETGKRHDYTEGYIELTNAFYIIM